MVKVLFVCMGNICRSPTAEGIFQKLVNQYGLSDSLEIDSAGTHAYHIEESPDPRAQMAAARREADISIYRARRVEERDFEYYDYILAMDRENLNNLKDAAPSEYHNKIELFLEYAPNLPEREVPDPYYGGQSGFERVLDLVEAASEGLLSKIILKDF